MAGGGADATAKGAKLPLPGDGDRTRALPTKLPPPPGTIWPAGTTRGGEAVRMDVSVVAVDILAPLVNTFRKLCRGVATGESVVVEDVMEASESDSGTMVGDGARREEPPVALGGDIDVFRSRRPTRIDPDGVGNGTGGDEIAGDTATATGRCTGDGDRPRGTAEKATARTLDVMGTGTIPTFIICLGSSCNDCGRSTGCSCDGCGKTGGGGAAAKTGTAGIAPTSLS